MFGFIKNKFLFIIVISIITLVLLIVGAVSLNKDKSLTFENDGYILQTNTKKGKKYTFKANTKYKKNANEEISFKNEKSKNVSVEQASFIHYSNGNIGYLKKGTLVNLNELNNNAINYYNITANNIINYDNGSYYVTKDENKITIDSFVGRISDNKYIIAGKKLKLKIPTQKEEIIGDYFEVQYVKDGIVRIANQTVNYQVTAQDSTISIGENIVVNLGNQKIFYNNDAKMLLSQITISGDENIDIDSITKKDEKDGGNGNGDGSGEGTESKDGTGEGAANTEGTDTEGNQTESTETTETGQTGEGGGSGGVPATIDAKIELIEVEITSTSIQASLQLNNASAIKGELKAILTNVSTGKRTEEVIPKTNGTFKVNKNALSPNTEYTLSIISEDGGKETQYFQKTFKTKDLGISLEKEYSTSNSLAYSILFNENTEVEKVRINIYNSNGEDIEGSTKIITNGIANNFIYDNLNSDTNYSIAITGIWINNIEYNNLYNINRIDTTLKKTPTISNIKVDANAEEVKFNIKLNKIEDKDNAIKSFVYKIYKADDIVMDAGELEPVYTVTKTDTDALVLDLAEVKELKTGVDYRCKIVAQYDDNEMTREVSSEYSSNFLIKSKPKIAWQSEKIGPGEIHGKLTLTDVNCTVPISGRACLSENNKFILRYYKLSDGENSNNDKEISINPSSLESIIDIINLSSRTTYAFKLYGNYYDDANQIHKNVQIGDTFYVDTDASEQLKFKVKGNNQSVDNGNAPSDIVTFNAMLQAPADSDASENIKKIKMNLYTGNYNTKEKLIGTYIMDDENTIKEFFDNFTITNGLFENEIYGKLDTKEKLIKVTNNATKTLSGTYTVEIESVEDATGNTSVYTVEDNIYTFNLTSSFYLDTRINTDKSPKLINVIPIKKEDLLEEEYNELKKKISNLDDLNDDIVVGLTIENTLSDVYVDSAFDYEKVEVNYKIYNQVSKNEIKTININMYNKYQPKTQTIYLDPTEIDDYGKSAFTRGYNYRVYYELEFLEEDGEHTVYTHDKLSENITIAKQEPIYQRYISTSTTNSITYRYHINDIDKALYDENIYYSIGKNSEKKNLAEKLEIDNKFHDAIIPIEEKNNYSVYISVKTTDGKKGFTEIANSQFESLYTYDNSNMYTLINNEDNKLKIKLENNEITTRAVAYEVSIKATSNPSITEYSKYFLAANLNSIKDNTGLTDEEGNNIEDEYKYIEIDYANIARFIKNDLSVSVKAYYDSGLIGINQEPTNGFILKNDKNKYLNIHSKIDNNHNITNRIEVQEIPAGILKETKTVAIDSDNIEMYSFLLNTDNKEPNPYNTFNGVSPYLEENIAAGMKKPFEISYTKTGITLTNGSTNYENYDLKVLKIADLKTSSKNYRFDSIIPKVSMKMEKNTINSIKIGFETSGIYNQFLKNGSVHNKFYIDVYSDETLENHITQLTTNITNENNSVTVDSIDYNNLKPNTNYYFIVSAYIDGKLTRLFDKNYSSKTSSQYAYQVYKMNTMGSTDILAGIDIDIKPIKYNGESPKKGLSWKIINTSKIGAKENYMIRMQLKDQEDNIIDFNGTKSTSCNNNDFSEGNKDIGYIKNCYIQVLKENIPEISNKVQSYEFDGDNFVFGENYYKFTLYAIPYTNGQYKLEDAIELYNNDSLSNLNGKKDENGIVQYIKISQLKEAELSIKIEKDCAGSTNSCYISVTPEHVDNDKVIKYGKYYIELVKGGINGPVVDRRTILVANGQQEILKSPEENKITFDNLPQLTLYQVRVYYESVYRNLNGLTEEEKNASPKPKDTPVYTPTPSAYMGTTIEATKLGAQSLIINHTNAYKVNEVNCMKYTISDGINQTEGKYTTEDNKSIFEMNQASNGEIAQRIDISQSNNSQFTLNQGSSYYILVEYYKSKTCDPSTIIGDKDDTKYFMYIK